MEPRLTEGLLTECRRNFTQAQLNCLIKFSPKIRNCETDTDTVGLAFTLHNASCYPLNCHIDNRLKTGVHQFSVSQRAKEIPH
jgi:hypothetical protein